jgi:hypothetical protein
VTLKAEATGAGTISYQWSNGPTTETISINRPGTYTVTITDTADCSASASITITGNTTPPTITILAFPEVICKGDSVTLVAIGADFYSWQPGGKTGSVIKVAPDVTTTYTVSGVGSNACLGTKSFEVVVRPLPTATVSGTRTVCQSASPPRITFTGAGATAPYTFTYRLNNGAIQTITTAATTSSVSFEVPTGTLGQQKYDLLSVSDSSGCTQPQTGSATITILSGPALTSTRDTTVCSNAVLNYTATSTVPGTTFTWSRAFVPGIVNPALTGNGDKISETLQNTTDLPIAVYYVFRLSTAGADCATGDSVRVVVNPTPKINFIRDTSFCNGAFVRNGIQFGSPSPNASFTWTNSNTTIGLPANGSGSLPAFIATNNTNAVQTATITVSVRAGADNCPGAPRRHLPSLYVPGRR